MTREEAIELLEDLDGAIEDNQGRDYDEAFRMAREALQKEIERQEMIIRASERYLGIVRCKNCKHKDIDGEVTRYYWCRIHERPVDGMYYCSWGEKNEVEK